MNVEKFLESVSECVDIYKRVVGTNVKPEKVVRALNKVATRIEVNGGYLHEDFDFSHQISPQFDRTFHDTHTAYEREYLDSIGRENLMTPDVIKRSNLTFEEKIEKTKECGYALAKAKKYGVERFHKEANVLITTNAMTVAYDKYKQIYSFDKDFIEVLRNTEQTKIPACVLDHLPYPAFCLDFSDNPELCDELQYECALVYVTQNTNAAGEKYHRLLIDGFSTDLLNNSTLCDLHIYSEDSLYNSIVDGVRAISIPLVQTVIQAITYLSSIDKDLEMDDKKHTAAPLPKGASKIDKARSRTSENKVGYHFGAVYREHFQKLQSEQTRNGRSGGHSDKPAVIRAHYQWYWCGKGKTEKRHRWKNPYFRNLDKGEIDASVHDVVTTPPAEKDKKKDKVNKKGQQEVAR